MRHKSGFGQMSHIYITVLICSHLLNHENIYRDFHQFNILLKGFDLLDSGLSFSIVNVTVVLFDLQTYTRRLRLKETAKQPGRQVGCQKLQKTSRRQAYHSIKQKPIFFCNRHVHDSPSCLCSCSIYSSVLLCDLVGVRLFIYLIDVSEYFRQRAYVCFWTFANMNFRSKWIQVPNWTVQAKTVLRLVLVFLGDTMNNCWLLKMSCSRPDDRGIPRAANTSDFIVNLLIYDPVYDCTIATVNLRFLRSPTILLTRYVTLTMPLAALRFPPLYKDFINIDT